MIWFLITGCGVFASAIGCGVLALAIHNRAFDEDCDDESAMVENAEMQRTIITRNGIETEI